MAKRGVYVLDEELHPSAKSTAPHYHLEDLRRHRGKNRDVEDFGDFQKNFNEKASRELEDQSNKLTKDAQDKIIQRSIDAYKISGVIPTGEILDKIQNKLADEAKKAGKIQLTKDEVIVGRRKKRRFRNSSRALSEFNRPSRARYAGDY